jgi:hypothetical protein
MPRRGSLVVAFALAACGAPEPVGTPSEAVRPTIAALAEMTGESVEALSNDPCIVGCAGAAVTGCSGVTEICDASFVFSYGGAWITCTEAIMAACGASIGLYQCATTCRGRS